MKAFLKRLWHTEPVWAVVGALATILGFAQRDLWLTAIGSLTCGAGLAFWACDFLSKKQDEVISLQSKLIEQQREWLENGKSISTNWRVLAIKLARLQNPDFDAEITQQARSAGLNEESIAAMLSEETERTVQ